jgi:hypothetical protein
VLGISALPCSSPLLPPLTHEELKGVGQDRQAAAVDVGRDGVKHGGGEVEGQRKQGDAQEGEGGMRQRT